MQSSRSNSIQPGRTEPQDLLSDYNTTPFTSPQTPRLPQDSLQGPSNMQAYSYHRGHQSFDNGRDDWRSESFGAQGCQVPPSPGVPHSPWTVTAPQRNPRFTQWRSEYSSNPPTTEDLRLIMSTGNEPSPSAPNVSSRHYAYCLDRGNGRVTRLIPADMLPPLKEIPQLESGKPGMEVLPHPTAQPPLSVAATNQNVTIQARRLTASSPHKPEKEKVYCTKWIHDGTCAFSHPGCRFKHVMPMDRETQLEVGLSNGLPLWWRKRQANLNRQAQHRSAGQDMPRLSLTDAPRNSLGDSVSDVPDTPTWRRAEGCHDNRGGLRGSFPDYGASGMYAKLDPIGPPRKEKE